MSFSSRDDPFRLFMALSHGMRTPLDGVIGLAELLLATDLDARQRDFAEAIFENVSAFLAKVNDLLDFAQIRAGTLKFAELDFDLRSTVEAALETQAKSARAKGIELVSHLDSRAWATFRGDPAHLQQVLTNLLSNAVKFTERGEVFLRITPEAEENSHVSLRFEVSDTGVGIPRAAMATLFRPCLRADATSAPQCSGAGLGLAICRQLVERMHGRIGVESNPGQGSTFWFTARFERPFHRLGIRSVALRGLEGVRTLIVDDHEANRAVLHHQVTSWRMQNGAQAASGLEGLHLLRAAALRGEPYEVVLLDLQMPGMDGFEVVRRIKADPQTSAAKVIMLSSFDQVPDCGALRKMGIEAFLVKPVKHARLFNALVTALGAAPALYEPKSGPPLADEPLRPDWSSAEVAEPRLAIAATPGEYSKENCANQSIAEACSRFAAESNLLCTTMSSALGDANGRSLQCAAKELREASATFGARHLQELCEMMEARAASNDIVAGAALLDSLLREHRRVLRALEKLSSAVDPGGA
jgi:CheY-like chemotaxis protein/anti-sigma regulatory factor (Ser/Thr protein kinase)